MANLNSDVLEFEAVTSATVNNSMERGSEREGGEEIHQTKITLFFWVLS